MFNIILMQMAFLLCITPVVQPKIIRVDNLPSVSDRQKDRAYHRFPNFQAIELVRDGELNRDLEVYISKLDRSQWHKDVSLDKLLALQLREFDIHTNAIYIEDNRAVVPFIINQKFIEKGLLASILKQGTLISTGEMFFDLSTKEVLRIDMLSYDDSSFVEKIGDDVGLINQYDEAFVLGVVVPVLTEYFMNQENAETLAEVVYEYGRKVEP